MLRKKRPPTDAELMDFWDCGEDTAMIARFFGVKEYTIANRMARMRDGRAA